MTFSRRTVATTAAAVALFGWAGVSAAQEGDLELSDIVEEHVGELPAPAAEAIELAEQRQSEEPEEPDETEGLDEVEGLEGERPENHGFYVSEATRTCPESGPERGACISEVARSDAGKPTHDDEVEGEESLEGDEGAGPPEHAGRPADVPRGPKPGKGPQG